MKEINEQDLQSMSIEEQFLFYQESYEQAAQRAAEESKSLKTEYFRMDKLGTYTFRILPVAPPKNGEKPRGSYEFPVHKMILKIQRPNKTGKDAFTYASVVRATYAGFKRDLIDLYRKLAIAEATEMGQDKLAEKIGGATFYGGLKFTYEHAMFVYDLNERAKGLQLLTLSHSQFKDLDDRKMKVWQKIVKNDPKALCPISSINQAYPVEIEKKKGDGGKTEYVMNVDVMSKVDVLSKEELTALMAAPRIPEIIYRYTRYHYEATLVFLKQCDADYGLKIMELPEMIEAVKEFEAEIPKDDTSSFSIDGKAGAEADGKSLTFEDLVDLYEELEEKGLGDKTEEGVELRQKLNEFIEQEKLDVKPSRRMSNSDILDEIELALNKGSLKTEDEDDEDPEQTDSKGDTEESDDPRNTRNDDTNEPAVRRRRAR